MQQLFETLCRGRVQEDIRQEIEVNLVDISTSRGIEKFDQI